ncbi:hypothetical protein V1509DRAFT_442182 [Lipomyces kononenkoae]
MPPIFRSVLLIYSTYTHGTYAHYSLAARTTARGLQDNGKITVYDIPTGRHGCIKLLRSLCWPGAILLHCSGAVEDLQVCYPLTNTSSQHLVILEDCRP